MPGVGLGLGLWNMGGRLWVPTDEPGLLIWIDASVGATPSNWQNDGSLADLTQSTAANQPATPVSWQGRLAVPIRRNQSNGDMRYYSVPNLSSLTEGHTFIAIEVDTDPPSAAEGTGGIWTMGTGITSYYPFQGDGTIYEHFGTNTRKTSVNPTPSLADPHIYEVFSKTNDWGNLLDGASLTTSGSNTVAFPAAPRLGGSATGGEAHIALSGLVGAWLVYDHKLSASAAFNVRHYLGNRFSIPVV